MPLPKQGNVKEKLLRFNKEFEGYMKSEQNKAKKQNNKTNKNNNKNTEKIEKKPKIEKKRVSKIFRPQWINILDFLLFLFSAINGSLRTWPEID